MSDLQMPAHMIDPEAATEGEMPAVDDTGTVRFIESSRPLVVLAPGSDATDVPAGTPDRSLIIVEA